ncbi:porin [Sulfitobacter sp. SK011]|nr:porin [Sulfitobacter sp. SK011]
MTLARTTIFPAVAGTVIAASLPFAVQSQETGVSIDFYGQLNLGIISVDDGFGSESAFTDNDNSNSRVGVIYKQGLSNGGEFRLHFESALGLTGSSSISRGNDDFKENFRRTDLRKFELIYQTPNIGTFSIGQGSIATDGSAEADFSGTSVIAYSSLQDQAGSQQFRLSTGANAGTTVGNAFSAFDGSRRFRVRYDTPTYNGFGLAVSAGEEVLARGNDGEFYDLGLKYDKDYGAYKVAGRLGYSIRDSAEELLLGSVAILHEPTGLNLAVAGGRQQQGDDNYVYVKGGLKRDWFAFGETAVSLDYYQGDDFQTSGSESTSYGIAAVQKLDAYGVELYASYRRFEFENAGPQIEDIDVAFVGARWKF